MSMTHDGTAHPNYMGVFWSLVVLTSAEVGVTFASVPKHLSITALLVLAFAKAALVALYFMHLKYERRTLYIVVLGPLFLAGLLMLVPTLDALLPY